MQEQLLETLPRFLARLGLDEEPMFWEKLIPWGFSSKKINKLLAISVKTGYVPHNQLSPALKIGMVLSEGTIHLSKWHPPVCNIENFYERRMLL